MAHPTVVPFDRTLFLVKEQKHKAYFKTKMFIEG